MRIKPFSWVLRCIDIALLSEWIDTIFTRFNAFSNRQTEHLGKFAVFIYEATPNGFKLQITPPPNEGLPKKGRPFFSHTST
jgi:hypothetical protein